MTRYQWPTKVFSLRTFPQMCIDWWPILLNIVFQWNEPIKGGLKIQELSTVTTRTLRTNRPSGGDNLMRESASSTDWAMYHRLGNK